MDYFPQTRLNPLTTALYRTAPRRKVQEKEKSYEKKLRYEFRAQVLALLEKSDLNDFQSSEDAFIFAKELLLSINKRYPACFTPVTTPIMIFMFVQIVSYCNEISKISAKITYPKQSTTLISSINMLDIDVLQKLDPLGQLSSVLFESLIDESVLYSSKWEDIYVYYGIINARWKVTKALASNEGTRREYVINYMLASARVVKEWIKVVVNGAVQSGGDTDSGKVISFVASEATTTAV